MGDDAGELRLLYREGVSIGMGCAIKRRSVSRCLRDARYHYITVAAAIVVIESGGGRGKMRAARS